MPFRLRHGPGGYQRKKAPGRPDSNTPRRSSVSTLATLFRKNWGNKAASRASYLVDRRPWDPAIVFLGFVLLGKDGTPVRKLLALLLVAGLCSLGCGKKDLSSSTKKPADG